MQPYSDAADSGAPASTPSRSDWRTTEQRRLSIGSHLHSLDREYRLALSISEVSFYVLIHSTSATLGVLCESLITVASAILRNTRGSLRAGILRLSEQERILAGSCPTAYTLRNSLQELRWPRHSHRGQACIAEMRPELGVIGHVQVRQFAF
jgi:hypothetical protein